MYFHNSLIPRGAYFLLPLESKQEATSGWNFTKCISEVKVKELKVKNMHVKMGIAVDRYTQPFIRLSYYYFFQRSVDNSEIKHKRCSTLALGADPTFKV